MTRMVSLRIAVGLACLCGTLSQLVGGPVAHAAVKVSPARENR
jgi:hypothetical protein